MPAPVLPRYEASSIGDVLPSLSGRFGLADDTVAELRELNLLYDRATDGGYFVHFYTRTVGSVFFEFVQRFDGYDGYGTDNAPVRLAAQLADVGTVRR